MCCSLNSKTIYKGSQEGLVLSFLHTEELKTSPVSELEVEIVERKGIGHPDSLIDGACEAVSLSLCDYYLKEFGTILHHNVDKGLLVGGRSQPRFGGGEVIEPIYILIAGRSTSFITKGSETISVPIGGIAISSVKQYLKQTVRHLDVEKHVVVDYRIKQGSQDLMSVFSGSKKLPLANDTSIGVAYAPFTTTEELVLQTEKLLNSERVKKMLPETGEDIKVMGFRRDKTLNLTIAVATVSGLIPDASHYQSVVEEAGNLVKDLAAKQSNLDVVVRVNTGDIKSTGSYYLTVTGTSAESGDDGNTGRGNRANGLIAPMRQYSMEATAGKNPVNHTGKIYHVIAQRAANRILSDVGGIREVYVRLLSRIGSPISEPQVASAALVLEKNKSLNAVRGDVEGIMLDELNKISQVTEMIRRKEVTLF